MGGGGGGGSVEITCKSTSNGVSLSSHPVVLIREIASATAFFGRSRYYTLKSNSCSLCRQCATFPVAYTTKSHFKASWSVRSVKRVPNRYGRSHRTAQMIAKHSLSVIS